MKPPRFPELDLLTSVVGDGAAQKLARAPGGWRTLSPGELSSLGVSTRARKAVVALQELTRRGYPELTIGTLACAEDVGRVYGERLGGDREEVVLAVAMDGGNHVLEEIVVAKGGLHGACVTPGDVLRPLIRAGASVFILVHNHPSGDPTPSREDIAMTESVRQAGATVGLVLLDHVIVGGHGGGWCSVGGGPP